MWISSCDICVIVDNSVETGDFFWNRGFLDKFCSLFFSERLQDDKCKSRKILKWSIEIGFILTGWVFLGVSYTESWKCGILFRTKDVFLLPDIRIQEAA